MLAFKEDNGNVSSMRVSLFVGVITACIVSVLCVLRDRNLMDAAVLVGAILAPLVGGKAIQKGKEQNVQVADRH